MTDIEKKAYKITLIRGVTIGIFLVGCTWRLSDSFNQARNEFYGLKKTIMVLAKNDSLNKSEIVLLKQNDASQKHDIDSIKRVLHLVVLKSHVKLGIAYYRQIRVNGKLITEPVSD